MYKSIVSVLGWCLKKNLNVAVGWLVDFEFTSQRLVLPLVGWLIPSCHCMFRAGRVYAELDAGPWYRFRTVCLAREDVYFGAL